MGSADRDKGINAIELATSKALHDSALLKLLAVLAAGMLVALGVITVKTLSGDGPILGEFSAFYTVGYFLNHYPAEKLYDFDSFFRVFHELFPHAPPNIKVPYSHAPFEALIYRPLALLPYRAAYATWIGVSLALYAGGIVWTCCTCGGVLRTSWLAVLLVALSFEPLSIQCLATGQVAAFSFFWMAAAVCLDQRGFPAASGFTLAFCLCKPTLLLLLIPMLVIRGRVRNLIGLCAGMVALAGVSLAAVGWVGCLAYLNMLLRFGGYTTSGNSPLNWAIYVDIISFFRLLFGGRGQLVLAAAAGASLIIAPLLLFTWKRLRGGGASGMAWAATIVWTLVMNLYVPKYDTPLVIIAILLLVRLLILDGRLPPAVLALLCAIYLAPWIPPLAVTHGARVNLYTLALSGLGGYAIALVLRCQPLALIATLGTTETHEKERAGSR